MNMPNLFGQQDIKHLLANVRRIADALERLAEQGDYRIANARDVEGDDDGAELGAGG